MYFGHTWSPMIELAITPALMHGHAISIDMCFSATLANTLNLLPEESYRRFLSIFSTFGLAMEVVTMFVRKRTLLLLGVS